MSKPINQNEIKGKGGCEEGMFVIDDESREIYLIGEVGTEMARTVIIAMRHFDKTPGPISIILTSGGGCESSGWAIYDAIRMSPNPVTITALGLCQSMAALIIQAGDKRFMSPECRFMIHNGSAAMEATIGQVRAISKEIELMTQKYYKTLSKRSGVSLNKIKVMCDRETFLSAEEAVELGFADAIIAYPIKGKKSKRGE